MSWRPRLDRPDSVSCIVNILARLMEASLVWGCKHQHKYDREKRDKCAITAAEKQNEPPKEGFGSVGFFVSERIWHDTSEKGSKSNNLTL